MRKLGEKGRHFAFDGWRGGGVGGGGGGRGGTSRFQTVYEMLVSVSVGL